MMKRVLLLAFFVLSAGFSFAQGVGLHVSAATGVPAGVSQDEWQESKEAGFCRIEYRGQVASGALEIIPAYFCTADSYNFFNKKKDGRKPGEPIDYLALLAKGGPITNLCYDPQAQIAFPALDVKIVNNSPKPLHFSEARIKVKQSLPDPTPLPRIESGYDQVQSLEFFNHGWDEIDTIDFDFSFSAQQPNPDQKWDQTPFHRTLQRVREKTRLSVSEELVKAKIISEQLGTLGKSFLDNEKQLAALRKTLPGEEWDSNEKMAEGSKREEELSQKMWKLEPPSPDGDPKVTWMFGTMKLSWKEGADLKTMALRFSCPILLVPPSGLGAVAPVSGKFEAMLRAEGAGYELSVPMSSVIQPGGVDHFIITLGVPRTSRHELNLVLRTTDQQEFTSDPVKINALLPPDAAERLAQPSGE